MEGKYFNFLFTYLRENYFHLNFVFSSLFRDRAEIESSLYYFWFRSLNYELDLILFFHEIYVRIEC